jgi:hypothetical protein
MHARVNSVTTAYAAPGSGQLASLNSEHGHVSARASTTTFRAVSA